MACHVDNYVILSDLYNLNLNPCTVYLLVNLDALACLHALHVEVNLSRFELADNCFGSKYRKNLSAKLSSLCLCVLNSSCISLC